MMSTPPDIPVPDIPVISSIGPLAAGARAWLVDVWGVMHNGVRPFAEAVVACQRFREAGGYVVLLTNAPRPADRVVAQLDGIGVARNAYDAVVTSGDVTRGLVTAWQDRRLTWIGPDRDRGIFEGLDIAFVPTTEAEIAVLTGLEDDETETPDDYRLVLERFLRKRVIMLCANPDVQAERGDRLVYCAGAIANAYETMGGEVVWAGKPHQPIYDLALGVIEGGVGRPVDKTELIAIGDGVRTDIRGAFDAGIPAVYIASAIHLGRDDLSPAAVAQLFAGTHVRPIAAMRGLAW